MKYCLTIGLGLIIFHKRGLERIFLNTDPHYADIIDLFMIAHPLYYGFLQLGPLFNQIAVFHIDQKPPEGGILEFLTLRATKLISDDQ